MYYGVDPSEYVSITEHTQNIIVHDKKVEVSLDVKSAALHIQHIEVVDHQTEERNETIQFIQTNIKHRLIFVDQHTSTIKELCAQVARTSASQSARMDQLLSRIEEERKLLAEHKLEIEHLRNDPIEVRYNIETTCQSASLTAGQLQHPAFLPKAVCWVPSGNDTEGLEVPVVRVYNVSDRKDVIHYYRNHSSPPRDRLLWEQECKWFNESRDSKPSPVVPQSKVAEYIETAEAGDAYGQYLLGRCYYAGWGGLAFNFSQAFKLFKSSSAQGNSWGQSWLGVCYQSGTGVTKSHKKAFELFSLAALQGNISAQSDLAECYRTGRGVAVDLAVAKHWYEQAAVQGYQHATEMLTRYFSLQM